jgi:hypothetical protein
MRRIVLDVIHHSASVVKINVVKDKKNGVVTNLIHLVEVPKNVQKTVDVLKDDDNYSLFYSK